MIRVNLLPRKISKKKLTIIRHLVLGLLLLTVFLLALGYVWFAQASKIGALKQAVAKAQADKETLKNVNQEKEKHEKNIEDLKHRIDVISRIEKGRTLPVRIMDEITAILDASLHAWLTSMNIATDKFTMDGYAFTNPDIARLVKKLEETASLRNVELIMTQKEKVSSKEIFRFSISADLESGQGG